MVKEEIKRAGICLLALMLFIVVVLFLRVKLFTVKANADTIYHPAEYPDFGEVIKLLPENALVVVQTHDGNQWAIVGIEDWMVGDHCCMVFNDSGTRNDRTDDWIVSARYIYLEK